MASVASEVWSSAQIVEALETAETLQRAARRAMTTEDVAERDRVLVTYRHVTALCRALEEWIAFRAKRTASVR